MLTLTRLRPYVLDCDQPLSRSCSNFVVFCLKSYLNSQYQVSNSPETKALAVCTVLRCLYCPRGCATCAGPRAHARRNLAQELPSRLHRARFSKVQASFEQKPIWRKLTKVPCSQGQRHNHPSHLHPVYMHANSKQYQHHQNTIMSQPSRYGDCTFAASPCQVSHQM